MRRTSIRHLFIYSNASIQKLIHPNAVTISILQLLKKKYNNYSKRDFVQYDQTSAQQPLWYRGPIRFVLIIKALSNNIVSYSIHSYLGAVVWGGGHSHIHTRVITNNTDYIGRYSPNITCKFLTRKSVATKPIFKCTCN